MKIFKNIVLVLVTMGWFTSAQAAYIQVSPSTQNINLGNTFSVDLLFDAQGNNLGLGAFDINIGYDSSILSFTSLTFGTGLDIFGLGDIQSTISSVGSVNLSETSLDSVADVLSYQPNSFKLATLTFSTLSTGINHWAVSINAIGDANGNGLYVPVLPSTLNVVAVPETDTYSMMVIGLGILGFMPRRRKADKSI
jgi:hypothetical protein